MKQITITVLMAFFVALQVFAERVDMREAGVDNQEALKNTEIINNTINRLNKAGGVHSSSLQEIISQLPFT